MTRSEKDKMLAGELYNAGAPDIQADLAEADISDADLRSARLSAAKLFNTKQAGADFQGATMPDNIVHP